MNCKILILSSEFPPGPGGIGNHAYNLAKFLHRSGYRVTVLTNFENASIEDKIKLINENDFKIHYIKRYNFVFYTYIIRVAKAITIMASSNISICLCSGKFSLWLGALLKTIGFKCTFIGVVHGSEVNFKSSLFKFVTIKSLTKLDRIIAVSEYTKSLLPKPIQISSLVIPNGIDCSHFFKNKFNGSIPGDPALLTIGSVTRRKGQQNMINALPAMINSYPNLHYHIAGLPILIDDMIRLVNYNKVNKYVTFHGKVRFDKLVVLLESCKVFCMLSESQSSGDIEGFGIAILEANLYGLPAIGSRNCGIEDAIKHGSTGYLVDPHNIEEISEALNNLISNYNFFSKNAVDWAKAHDWGKIVKQYQEALSL